MKSLDPEENCFWKQEHLLKMKKLSNWWVFQMKSLYNKLGWQGSIYRESKTDLKLLMS